MQVIYHHQTAERERRAWRLDRGWTESEEEERMGEEERENDILCVILLKEAIREQKGPGR